MKYKILGLGKTVQIIAFLSALYHKTGLHADNDENRLVSTGKNPCSPTLIICPGSVLSNWEEEIKTWGNFVTKVWKYLITILDEFSTSFKKSSTLPFYLSSDDGHVFF